MAAWLTPHGQVTLPNPDMEVLFICFPFFLPRRHVTRWKLLRRLKARRSTFSQMSLKAVGILFFCLIRDKYHSSRGS